MLCRAQRAFPAAALLCKGAPRYLGSLPGSAAASVLDAFPQKSVPENTFAARRRIHREQLSSLRIQWATSLSWEQRRKENHLKFEKERTNLGKAKLIRVKTQQRQRTLQLLEQQVEAKLQERRAHVAALRLRRERERDILRAGRAAVDGDWFAAEEDGTAASPSARAPPQAKSASQLADAESALARKLADEHAEKAASSLHARRLAVAGCADNLLAAIEAESASFITMGNLESKIHDGLWQRPAHTGFLTRLSANLAFHPAVPAPNRPVQPSDDITTMTPLMRDALVRSAVTQNEFDEVRNLMRPLLRNGEDARKLDEFAQELIAMRSTRVQHRIDLASTFLATRDLIELMVREGGRAPRPTTPADLERMRELGFDPEELFTFVRQQRELLQSPVARRLHALEDPLYAEAEDQVDAALSHTREQVNAEDRLVMDQEEMQDEEIRIDNASADKALQALWLRRYPGKVAPTTTGRPSQEQNALLMDAIRARDVPELDRLGEEMLALQEQAKLEKLGDVRQQQAERVATLASEEDKRKDKRRQKKTKNFKALAAAQAKNRLVNKTK